MNNRWLEIADDEYKDNQNEEAFERDDKNKNLVNLKLFL
jgi:hypothetical protein